MRLELKDGKSDKFWEVDRSGKVLHVRYGKNGSQGQTTQKTFASPEEAARELTKLLASKQRKGYAEVARSAKAGAAPKQRPARLKTTVKASGRAAALLGALQATTPSLTIIVVDAADAAAWRGSNKNTGEGAFPVGREKAVRVHLGTRSAWSGVWKIEDGVAMVDAAITNPKDRDRALALRVAQWPVTVMPKVVGKVVIHSGVLALLLLHRDGTFSPADLAKAHGGSVVRDKQGDRILIPVTPGKYDVERYPFRPVRERGDYKDKAGEYGNAVLVSYRDRLPAKYR